MQHHYVSIVKPIVPQTAPLPISIRDVAPPPTRALPQRYAQPDTIVNQVRPTLAALPAPAGFELDFVAWPARPPSYAQPEVFCGPAKFALTLAPATPTVSGWTPTLAPPAQPQKFTAPHFASQVRPTLAALPLLAAADFTPGSRTAQPQDYAPCTWTTPDKAQPVTIAPLFSWRAEDPYVPKSDWYTMGDTLSGVGTIAGVVEALAAVFTSPISQPPRFSFVPLAAPEKVGITAPATPTVSGWTPTVGVNAQPLRYDRGSYAAPDKFTAFVPATPTASSWTSTAASSAQPQSYDRGSFAGPDKAAAFAAATPTVSGWTSTLGAPAIVLRYAAGDIYSAPAKVLPFTPVIPTIASWTSQQSGTAQPLDYDRGNFAAPDKSGFAFPVIPAVSAWTSTDARGAIKLTFTPGDQFTAPVLAVVASAAILGVARFRTFSSLEASRFVIISED